MARQPVISRRRLLAFATRVGAASLLPCRGFAQDAAGEIVLRAIPGSGERLPAVGLGTAGVFDVGADAAARAKLGQVVQTLIAGGGRIIDTASSYGNAESVIGELLAGGLRAKIFLATKLESPDAAELKQSLQRLRTDSVDLLQLHNVRSGNQSLAQFREWKAQGICRYIGITSTYHRDFAAVEAVLRREKPDFVQVDYSLDNREVEERLLPRAAEAGAAVLTALPFGRARLFRAVRGKELPQWAGEFDARTWAQFFLKFLLGDARVTAVIPGTADPAHMADNLGAMRGRLPDAALRRRMVQFVQNL
jgi:aryl-alcohol dehydrogenase-like predicted oxidoreductase